MNWKSSLSIAHGGTAARLVIMGPRNYVRHVCKHAICECLIRKLFFNHHYQVIGRAHQKECVRCVRCVVWMTFCTQANGTNGNPFEELLGLRLVEETW